MIEELHILKTKILALDEITFINDKVSEKELEKACVNYLKVLGYKVNIKPTLHKVNKLDELIDLFYHLMEFYHNDVCSLVSNRKKDRSLISNFIKNRQKELGCSFKEGLQDCANIIYGLFIFEDQLGLTSPANLSVFGNDKCKWITDKVITILNSNKDVVNEIKVEKMILEQEVEAENSSGFNFEELRRKYGEKENRK